MEEEKVLLFSCEAGRKRHKRLDRLRVNNTTHETGNPNERTLEANTTTDSQREGDADMNTGK